LLHKLSPLVETLAQENWWEIKRHYEVLIEQRPDFGLAETVFNTVCRRLFLDQLPADEFMFVRESLAATPHFDADLLYSFGPSQSLEKLVEEILFVHKFETPWLDIDLDIESIVNAMRESVPLLRQPDLIEFTMLKHVFYRNKGAYLIGKMTVDVHIFPIAIPIQNRGDGLLVDAILWNERDLSRIFSFTRAYFMVDVNYPNEMVEFLLDLLPNKKAWELYMSLGFYKHGKTVFYRSFLEHLDNSNDQFVVAEGIKGLVMAVFALPSYQVVFKIIKDKFSPTKRITRDQVRDAYYLVKTHDRVGRMADTQEFSNISFPRHRFSDELIAELQRVVPSSITLTEDLVIVSHLYTERMMTPLNLYLRDKSGFELHQVIEDYGSAIKQLAAANIFPGDMLLKNFGVTRHGRVVFYDYDEICYLTQINFRKIPAAQNPEDVMSAEPWYDVGPNDVFPEEFENFLFNSGPMKDIFTDLHGDLFTAEYWQGLQNNIKEQQILDVFPYPVRRRFQNDYL
jgi:isocitrate dehydrogenase kinase/phosphatase